MAIDATIRSGEAGIDRNKAGCGQIRRPNDRRDRCPSIAELRGLKQWLDRKVYGKVTGAINRTFCRLRMLALIALATGMRVGEIFALEWKDVP